MRVVRWNVPSTVVSQRLGLARVMLAVGVGPKWHSRAPISPDWERRRWIEAGITHGALGPSRPAVLWYGAETNQNLQIL